MNLAEKAFKELFSNKKNFRALKIDYSGKFKPYNANVKYSSFEMKFNLSKEWNEISDEIQIGLMQSLLLKVFKKKGRTINIDLYEKFVKNVSKYGQVEKTDDVLEASFDRNNKKYFYDFLEKPNLVWGRESFTRLGRYEYLTNTITISTILKTDKDMLDFVMYHEMLHKKLNYHSKNGRNYHHTAEFRRLEKQFETHGMDQKLTSFLRKKRLKKAFRLF